MSRSLMTQGQFKRRVKKARRVIERDGLGAANGRWQDGTVRQSSLPRVVVRSYRASSGGEQQ